VHDSVGSVASCSHGARKRTDNVVDVYSATKLNVYVILKQSIDVLCWQLCKSVFMQKRESVLMVFCNARAMGRASKKRGIVKATGDVAMEKLRSHRTLVVSFPQLSL
jgi:hypothetical protein